MIEYLVVSVILSILSGFVGYKIGIKKAKVNPAMKMAEDMMSGLGKQVEENE